MSLAVSAGTYTVDFSAYASLNLSNRDGYISIYADGVLVANSERVFGSVTNRDRIIYTQAQVITASSITIEARYRVDSAVTFTMKIRNMIITQTS